jgi:virulence-associated protein VapD
MHAICFDLNTDAVKRLFPNRSAKPYDQISRFLNERGFCRVQGSIFYAPASWSALDCFMAIIELKEQYAWFTMVVRDLRMLEVPANDNLMMLFPLELPLDRRA